MSTVTVCVPAYRTGSFLRETLCSVQAQTYSDFKVEIAIEPPQEPALSVVESFLRDPRFCCWLNEERLGWDCNVAAQISRVTTPYFMILPHDDFVEPNYIASLMELLRGRSDASVAYSDMEYFGNTNQTRTLPLPVEGPVEERLLAFFLGRAEAIPWRGVTRTSVARNAGGHPTDGFGGFAVECEWTLALLLAGPAIREATPLYWKRKHPRSVPTASRSRIRDRSREQLVAAMERHRRCMLEPVAFVGAATPTARLVHLAAEAAMLLRHTEMVGALTPMRFAEATALLAQLQELIPEEGRAALVSAMVMQALDRHTALTESGTAHR